MTYELALQLKEAGFPQEELDHTGQHFISYEGEKAYDHSGSDENECLIPSLNQLIEACGTSFEGIYQEQPDQWGASGWDFKTPTSQVLEAGVNPTEAVARLWLALHKK